MEKKRSVSRLALAFFLNLGFSVFEVIGGFFTNSVAILSDAIHDLGDSVAIGISWLMDWKAKKKPNETYTYGYARYSLLGALISSLILLVGSALVIFEAVNRFIHPEPVKAIEMIWFAVIGIVINGIAAWNSSKGSSLNEKAVGLHLFEDVFGWIAVLLGAVAMSIWNIPILDSLLSVAFTLYILSHVIRNLKQIIEVFLEKAPEGINLAKIEADLGRIDGVVGVHHIHVWSLEGRVHLITLHVVLKNDLGEEAYLTIQKKAHEALAIVGLRHATIEFEYENASCNPQDIADSGLCEDDEEDDHKGHSHH